MATRRGPGQRAGLTRDAVLDAARELLTAQGIKAVTMRGLAQRLAVAPNAIYSHVADKDQLLDGLLDDALAQVKAPDPEDVEPIAGLTRLMTSTFDVLTGQPDLVPIFVARQGTRGPNANRLGEVMDRLLDRAGVDPAAPARRALICHTIGSAALATGMPGIEQRRSVPDSRADFAQSLRWLLTGISRA